MKRIYLVNDESCSNQASDKEKLETLKSNLYKQASLSKDCEKIERAIDCFSQSSSESDAKIDNSQENQQEKTFLWQLNGLCENFLYAGLLVTVFSYLVAASGVCSSINSKFCASSQVIPNAISDYFSNQTVEPTSDR